jgi:hypothetical protein|tara:strand:+ start:560 stop:718 length:159 start_codon:yes stop_codon:yes gene_type:complete
MATRATQTTINLETSTKEKLRRHITIGNYATWDQLMLDVVKLIEMYEQGIES